MDMFAVIVMTLAMVAGQAPATTSPAPVMQPAPIYTPGMKLYVDASGLAFRRGPSLDTERIHYITHGDEVTVLEDNRVPVSFEAEGIKGHWLYVQHGAYKGYVFDGFLSPDPPPLDLRIDWTFVPGARVGPITAQTDYDELVATFGAANVTDAPVDLGEGETEPGTAALAGTPEALVIQWESYRKRPKAVHMHGEGGRWKSLDGIGIGTPLSTLVRLNGKPIEFAGLGWDNSGYVTNWNGGALERSYTLRSRFELNLAPVEPYTDDDYLALAGDSEFSSDLTAVGRLNLRITRIVIHLSASSAPEPGQPSGTAPAQALRTYSPGATYYVLASKLNVRVEPVLGSDLVASIPYGAQVSIAQEQGPEVPLTSEGMPGQWVAVDYSGLRGFVFDAYLSPLPTPGQGSRGLADYANAALTPAGASGDTPGSVTFSGGVRLEVKDQQETSLVVPGMSVPQAFVLAKRAIPNFAGAQFATGASGVVKLQSGSTSLTIRPEPGGAVRITEGRGAGVFAP